MRSFHMATALAAGALGIGLSLGGIAIAQETKTTISQKSATDGGQFHTRDELHVYYDKKFAELDRRRIEDLTRLAARQTGDEAEATYQELFNIAVARDAYETAEKAAETYLGSGKGRPQLRGLATFIHAIAEADRGHDRQALQDLEQFLKTAPANEKLDANTVFAVGEAFLQRMIRAGRYETARRVCDLFIAGYAEPAVKEHFNSRLARIEMLGKPAPAIEGTDIDGRRVSLADFKGKIVLVDFWATWCPPCVAELPTLNSLYSRYGDKGFAIVGVNLDSMREGVREANRVLPGVRRFLVDFRVSWPNLMNAAGGSDIAKAYGVTDIPATFLIDRDGKIVQVELSGPEMEKAVAQAVEGKGETKSARR